MRLVALCVLACACNADSFSGADAASDSAPNDAPPLDAPPSLDAPSGRCTGSKPFDAPIAVASLNTKPDQGGVWLTPDERVAYVISGGVLVFSRPSTAVGFTYQSMLAIGNAITSAWLTDNQQNIYFGYTSTLWTASRSSIASQFGPPVTLTPPLGTGIEYGITLTADQQTVFFDSIKNSVSRIYVSQFVGASFGVPTSFDQGATTPTDDDSTPVVNADGRSLYFASTRPNSTGGGKHDLWVARRSSGSGTFSAPHAIVELNTSDEETPAWVSADDCVLYFMRGSVGSRALYTATRPL